MIVQNNYNHKSHELTRFRDVLEDKIRPNKLNASALETHLARINKGSKRRERNNHALRLAQYKAR